MNNGDLAKFLVLSGIALVLLGGAVYVSGRFGHFGLGKLPGDIRIEHENVRIYLPIVTCILISLLASAVLYIITRLR